MTPTHDSTERPSPSEHAPFFAPYVALISEEDVLAVLASQPADLERLARAVSPERETYRYAPDKWSLRQVFGHLGDAERVFGYRAFCISRGDPADLPGFDEDQYVAAAGYDDRPLLDLWGEIAALRAVNQNLLERLDAEAWRRVGMANGHRTSVRALAFVMAGHVRHHIGVIDKRYGIRAAH